MNQNTLQNIYKTFETDQFYKRYLVELGCREDRRKTDQQRPIKITARNNSVVLSCGQTILIAHMIVNIDHVTFSPVSNSYGEPLLKLKVVSSNQTKHRQNKADRAIEQFINKHINWSSIEDQLVGSDLASGKQYGYKGEISMRVLGDDGGVLEYGLLAVQLLLEMAQLRKFTVIKERINYQENYRLRLSQFIYPSKYCHIIHKLIVDPSLSEEQNCELTVTVLKDLKQVEHPQTVIQRARKQTNEISEQTLREVLTKWQADIAKVHAKFQTLKLELQSKGEYILE